jgi:hypothetical protein
LLLRIALTFFLPLSHSRYSPTHPPTHPQGCDCQGCEHCGNDDCCIMLQLGEFVHEDEIAKRKGEEGVELKSTSYDIRAQMAAPAITY